MLAIRGEGLCQCAGARSAPGREPGDQAVEEQVGRSRRLGSSGGTAGRLRGASASVFAAQVASVDRVLDGFEVNLPGQGRVERGELAGGVQEQLRRAVQALRQQERSPRLQQLEVRPLGGPERALPGDADQLAGCGGCPGGQLGPGRGQGPPSTPSPFSTRKS